MDIQDQTRNVIDGNLVIDDVGTGYFGGMLGERHEVSFGRRFNHWKFLYFFEGIVTGF